MDNSRRLYIILALGIIIILLLSYAMVFNLMLGTISLAVFTTAFVFALVFSGKMAVSMDDKGLHIDAPLANKRLCYKDIVSAELRWSMDVGYRTGGYASTKMLSGSFRNKEFGNYTLACHAKTKAYVVVKPTEGKILVFNLDSVDKTTDFYNRLTRKLREP